MLLTDENLCTNSFNAREARLPPERQHSQPTRSRRKRKGWDVERGRAQKECGAEAQERRTGVHSYYDVLVILVFVAQTRVKWKGSTNSTDMLAERQPRH